MPLAQRLRTISGFQGIQVPINVGLISLLGVTPQIIVPPVILSNSGILNINSRQAFISGIQLHLDTFVDPDNTQLVNHTPDVGNGYTTMFGDPANAIVLNNTAKMGNSLSGQAIITNIGRTSGYRIDVEAQEENTAGAPFGVHFAATSGDTSNYYYARLLGNEMRLRRVGHGGSLTLASLELDPLSSSTLFKFSVVVTETNIYFTLEHTHGTSTISSAWTPPEEPYTYIGLYALAPPDSYIVYDNFNTTDKIREAVTAEVNTGLLNVIGPQASINTGGIVVPDWQNVGATYWSGWDTYINDIISQNTLGTEAFSTFSVTTPSGAWVGGVLAENGFIYGIPQNATTVLKINPADNTYTTFGSLLGSAKWSGGVLAHNGMIYGIPRDSTTVLKIDPNTDTVSTFGSLPGLGKWWGGVIAENGMIYGIPWTSGTVLKIDPNTDTVSTFGSLGTATNKWWGGTLAPNGMIYGAPNSAPTVLKINPNTDTATTFGSVGTDTGKWSSIVTAQNGKLYAIPTTSTTVLKVDPDTDTITTFGALTTGTKWLGGVLAPNGYIYGTPRNNSNVVRIDPSTDSAVVLSGGIPSGNNKWWGAVMAPNGKIFGIPFAIGSSLVINPDLDVLFDENVHLSGYYNKL